ncbi:MAG: 4a-hydroxytetrahydrobiopterin dehydratase [Proteobacteria bacterium]|nr:4a-hydroxytetrahydrobiopterin dehydratase [Pseudomonadota bacterium]
MTDKLTDTELKTALGALNQTAKKPWSIVDAKLSRNFRFKDFAEAFSFMTHIALVAERLNHHPEWFNVYANVDVQLTTHDAGGISKLDFEMARAMDQAAR